MKIRKSTWHAKLFRFIQDRVFDGGYEEGTNLCHYMRVILLWGSLTVIILLAAFVMAISSTFLALFYWAYTAYGLMGVAVEWASLLAFALFCYYGIPALLHKVVAEDSIIRCAFERTKAAKQKICPLVSFNGD